MKPKKRHEFSLLSSSIKTKYYTTNPRIGDRVRLKNYTYKHNGKLGFIVNRDGGYFYVRLRWRPKNDIHEVYQCEFDLAPYK